MKAIDNSSALNYCYQGANILNADVNFLVAGSKYQSAPTVAFSGGGGTGAAGTATVVDGYITGVTITNGGSGYSTPPTIAFTGGSGSGATALAVLTAGVVTGVTITSAGAKTITITDNTVYPAGDSRKVVNLTFADRFGNKKEAVITSGSNTVTIDVEDAGLNDANGIDILATVISVLHMHKNGSIQDVVTIKTYGNFTMDK